MDPNKRPKAPLFINHQDIALIEDCSIDAARKKLTQIKKNQGLGKGDKLSIWAYCKDKKITLEQVTPFFLRVLIIAVVTMFVYACGKIIYNKLYNMYRENKAIKWNVITPTHMEGVIYDSAGNRKVQVDWIGPKPNQ